MRANEELSPKQITIGVVKQYLAEGYFFLPTKMSLIFRDWDGFNSETRNKLLDSFKNTLVSDAEIKGPDNIVSSSSSSSSSDPASIGIKLREFDETLYFHPGLKVHYSGILENKGEHDDTPGEDSQKTLAQALEIDALKDTLFILSPLPLPSEVLSFEDNDQEDDGSREFYLSQTKNMEQGAKVNALFVKFSLELLTKKYPKSSDEYKLIENELLLQSNTPEAAEERKTFRNETIWSGIDLDRCYDFVTTFYEAFSRLEEKKQKFQASDPDAAEAIRNMQDSLTQKIDAYVQGNLNNEDFYSQCMAILDDERIRQPLEKHRGCAGIFSGLTRVLSNFAALFGFRTDSAKKLDALKEELAALTGHPSPEAQRTEEFFDRLGNFDMDGPGSRR
ncbi:hypothetical protein Lgee_1149 [Legionella geestiana]|uniref:Uncharacterized protein n=1 Tax=Legionella geestiana TaxID=45065 RepID=A0A0W0TVL0_9GAMM|nr:hypothetical protein [Legionella geestiana]KTC99657.1 hypothetical protein Lgee_1149 [Legionella geestiana]QBS13220.1 hypothetical protein E4T54_10970 [Legionella geestiana]STX54257.1 Uncharacterised protein [Legionella geestiana]